MIPYSYHSFGPDVIETGKLKINPETYAVLMVMRGGRLTGDSEFQEAFESRFADYVGAKYAVAVNSGAAALYLALKATFPEPGRRILTSPLTYVATANSIVLAGHIPIFSDIQLTDFNIDPYEIPNDVDGIIPVHYAGHPCDLDQIALSIPDKPIIEDAAHACGAEYHGGKVGSFNTTCFSFHPCKNMTTAEGGMITTDSKELADRLKRMRLNGIQKDGIYQDMIDFGFKFNMNEISTAIGIEQLKKIERLNDRRREIAGQYDEAIKQIGWEGLRAQKVSPAVKHSRHLYPILTCRREDLIKRFQGKGIGCAIHYKPVHLMTWYQETYGFKRGDFPMAELVSSMILSIPLYPDLIQKQIDLVIETIKEHCP